MQLDATKDQCGDAHGVGKFFWRTTIIDKVPKLFPALLASLAIASEETQGGFGGSAAASKPA